MRNILNITFLIFLNVAFSDKKYNITNVNIVAQLNSDGSMDIVEERTYYFKGKFKYAFQNLNISDEIKYSEIAVFEEKQDYFLSDDNEQGTFSINEKDEYLKVRWNFNARNESRTFILKYKVHNVVKRYNDVSVIYHKFIGSSWKKRQEKIKIKLLPPQEINKDKVQAWIYGPLWASYIIDNKGIVIATAEQIPKKTFLEIISLYPPDNFPQLDLINENVKNKIILEQEEGVLEANRLRELSIEKEIAKNQRLAYAKYIVIPFSLLMGIL